MKTQLDAARTVGTAPARAQAKASHAFAAKRVVRQLPTLFSGPATRQGRRLMGGCASAPLGRAG